MRLHFLNFFGSGILLSIAIIASLSVGFSSFLISGGGENKASVNANVGNVYTLFAKGSIEPFSFSNNGFRGPNGSLLETGDLIYQGTYYQAKASSLTNGDNSVNVVFTLAESPSLFLDGGYLNSVSIAIGSDPATGLNFNASSGQATTTSFSFPFGQTEELSFTVAYRFQVSFEEAAALASTWGRGPSFNMEISVNI